MPDENTATSAETQNQSKPSVTESAPVADQKITLDMNEFQSVIRATVEGVLKNSQLDDVRRQVEEYNSKIAESVKQSQASLIKSNRTNGQTNTDYIKRVLNEDNRRRFQSGEGKALYSDKGEDFIKAKIVLLHRMGLKEEEIAKELADIL